MTQRKEPGIREEHKLRSKGREKALALMHDCSTQHGFIASPTDRTNYRRIWARDGCIVGLAGLLSDDSQLVAGLRRTLLTLARYQGPHGEIPSNVDPRSNRISYGGTTGRVDADLWFLIGCAEYFRATHDREFLDKILDAIERVAFLLGAWEYNNRGLLFVPPTGDWADEYIHSGYVLYDQLLYLQAKRSLCFLHHHHHGSRDHHLEENAARMRELIRANYWLCGEPDNKGYVYHEVLLAKGKDAAARRQHSADYWMPFFSPTGYGYRFDALANVLTGLFGVADKEQASRVDAYINEHAVDPKVRLLPAFLPVITREDEGWKKLHVSFSHTFKNAPYEYQNGGLWPMVTGFYVASLAFRGQQKTAQQFLDGIHEANRSRMGDDDWSFPEYLHGKTHAPGGTRHMGWSAAAAIIGQAYLDGKRLFGDSDR